LSSRRSFGCSICCCCCVSTGCFVTVCTITITFSSIDHQFSSSQLSVWLFTPSLQLRWQAQWHNPYTKVLRFCIYCHCVFTMLSNKCWWLFHHLPAFSCLCCSMLQLLPGTFKSCWLSLFPNLIPLLHVLKCISEEVVACLGGAAFY